MPPDDMPESGNLVIRHLQVIRKEMGEFRKEVGERFDQVDDRLVKVEATLKSLTVDLQIAARVTATEVNLHKLEVEVAKLKKARR